MTYVPGRLNEHSSILSISQPNQKNKVGALFSNMKHKLDKLDKTGVLYKMVGYFGGTIQFKQYKNLCVPKKIAKHTFEMNHTFDFDNVKILCQNNNKRKL